MVPSLLTHFLPFLLFWPSAEPEPSYWWGFLPRSWHQPVGDLLWTRRRSDPCHIEALPCASSPQRSMPGQRSWATESSEGGNRAEFAKQNTYRADSCKQTVKAVSSIIRRKRKKSWRYMCCIFSHRNPSKDSQWFLNIQYNWHIQFSGTLKIINYTLNIFPTTANEPHVLMLKKSFHMTMT